MLNNCPVCKNPYVNRPYKVNEYQGMGVYKKITHYEKVCPYCEWKGTSGPGKQLKEGISTFNKEKLNGI